MLKIYAAILFAGCFSCALNAQQTDNIRIEDTDAAISSGRAQAVIKKTERENTLVYSFRPAAAPDAYTLEKSIEKFRQLEGFISLALNPQNEVEIITSRNIAEKNLGHIMVISARLYGHLGYQIVQ